MAGAKTSVYLDSKILDAIRNEAARQGRSISFILSQSWLVAQKTLSNYPGINDFVMAGGDEDEESITQDLPEDSDVVEEI